MIYTIVTSETRTTLIKKVNDTLSKGWRPIGGVSFSEGVYMQALYNDLSPSIFDSIFAKPKLNVSGEAYAH